MGTAASAWVVFDYEVGMLRAMGNLLRTGNAKYSQLEQELRNAVVESAVLHARILADVILSRGKTADDIRLNSLLPGFVPRSLGSFEAAYGNAKTASSPCHTFNKMLAHPTMLRSDSFDYSSALNSVVPLIEVVVQEIQAKRSSLGIH